MDPQSRQTASIYINNLLLSRGLLRNGMPIEFAKPEEAEGGLTGTMSQVMNLVHDLILRRDREADSLTNLSISLSTLRTTTTSQTATIAKLEANTAALDRQLALTTAQERAARATLRSAETRNRALREEMVRLKGSVAQVRAQCATDVRRRDGEIARLKKHLEGRRGRDGGAPGVGVVVIAPGVNGRNQSTNGQTEEEGSVDLLKQETTEFLTRLSQGLSDENDALIGLVRGTLSTLRSLQGLPHGPSPVAVNGEFGEVTDDVEGFMNGPPSVDALALSTDEVLEHLRGLLTNPNFVPLEEVETREEEIQRLREGWEKMALRWKEAMTLMDGWKKRVADTGDTINLDDLKNGLKLGNGIPSAVEARISPAKNIHLIDDSSVLQEHQQQQEDIIEEEAAEMSEPFKVPDVGASVADRVLADKSGNSRPPPEPRDVSLPGITEQNKRSIDTEDELSLLDFSKAKTSKESPVKQPPSRIPLQARPKSPERTVQQKLEQAQMEAEKTRTREVKRVKRDPIKKKLKGSRRRSTLSPEELENLMGIT